MARSGGRWRDLPEQFGDYETVKRRYYRWIEMGVLDAVLAAFACEADLEWLMINLTIVRASARSRRAPAKRGADAQGLGRSRGGLSTKIHAAGDALGNPVRLIGSPGQRNDIAFAHELVEGFAAQAIIADKGYDADHLCDRIVEIGSEVVIPPKRNRTFKRPYDAKLYKSATSSSASSISSNIPPRRTRYTSSSKLHASSNSPLSQSAQLNRHHT